MSNCPVVGGLDEFLRSLVVDPRQISYQMTVESSHCWNAYDRVVFPSQVWSGKLVMRLWLFYDSSMIRTFVPILDDWQCFEVADPGSLQAVESLFRLSQRELALDERDGSSRPPRLPGIVVPNA